jgi:glycosyltransferase involved in cell wall biosynthesis
MRLFIESGKASEIFYNGKFYRTGTEIEVPFSEGLRLAKTFNLRIPSDKVAYNPVIFKDDREVAMLADIDTTSGWGNVGLNLIKYSSPYISTTQFGRLLNISDGVVLSASKKEINPSAGLIIHEQPKEEWLSLPFERKIAIVPFETTRIPPSWVHRINSCHALIVPCRQNVDMMKDSGVTIPIEVVHWGVDTKKFYKIERNNDRPFTFGIMGSLTKRKGIDTLIDAFFRAFPNEKDVRLICKTSNSFFLWGRKDRRMKIDMTPSTNEELIDGFFREIDCFVWPSHGEGFGLPPLEAMATGVPVIATGWSGMADYMIPEVGWTIDYTMDDAKDFTEGVYKEPCGQWAIPKINHLMQLMRHAYENQDEVRQKGAMAAEYVKNEWGWENKIDMYKEALEKHL